MQGHLAQSLYYGGFTVNAGQGTLLQFMRQGDSSLQICQSRTNQIVTVYRSLCPQCKVSQTACTSHPSDDALESLSEAPIDYPSARTAGAGALVYLSDDPAESLKLCQQTASVNPDLKCLEPGQARPLPASDYSAKTPGMRADRLVAKFCIGLGLLIIVVSGALYVQKRSANLPFAKGQTLQKLILAVGDLVSIALAYYLVGLPDDINPVALYQYDLRQVALQLGLGLAVVGWLWVHYQQYTRRRPLWDELRELFKTLVAATLISATALFYSEVDAARNLNIWAWGLCFLLVPVGRIAARQVLNSFGLWARPVLIVGTGPNAIDAYRAIRGEFALGYQVIGFVETDADTHMQSTHIEVDQQFFKKYRYGVNFKHTLNKLHGPQLVLALESLASPNAQMLLQRLPLISDNIHVIPTLRGLPLFGAQLSHFFSHEVLFLTLQNNLSRRSYLFFKRVIDIVASIVLIALLSPLLAYVAWSIYRESGGPVIFSQPRVAFGNKKTFRFYKFRSMVNNADAMLSEWRMNNTAEWQEYSQNNFKLKNDPRVLKVGRWIRSTSIDELPQLFNVLLGDMSLVGPRPLLERELPEYGLNIQLYKQARPGITGLWQVSGRSQTQFSDRVHLDQWYIQNWSMWYDIAILFKTCVVVFDRKGAF
ncbi:MAG TPA: undecaprenyl-phosphate galactose phosphotransferase WbaP [Limnobacter sp.]|uniref:undecaprenyl-phosphate galactose phosphotransferase WbaP n=1 Tax=Limnobacter sp. TaxID=2003368 RepID=UPI002E325190|nr:undecaprenyl-phosphate galactose phosphotransferase WbaP [Limnobacter sp.]HEX5485081.1 undecaprenyl-phosphate galactose phosphotransferase WbaP [Limnobacter sp.]